MKISQIFADATCPTPTLSDIPFTTTVNVTDDVIYYGDTVNMTCNGETYERRCEYHMMDQNYFVKFPEQFRTKEDDYNDLTCGKFI